MRASIFISASAFAVAALAADSSSSIDPAPQTSFLTETNSLGVVTGIPTQPAVVTSIAGLPSQVLSQPPVASSVGVAASIPAVGPGLHTIIQGVPGTNQTRTFTVSANNSTTVVLSATPTPTGATVTGTKGATGSDATGASRTGSGTGSQSTGAAATMRAVAGSVVGVGAFMAAFL